MGQYISWLQYEFHHQEGQHFDKLEFSKPYLSRAIYLSAQLLILLMFVKKNIHCQNVGKLHFCFKIRYFTWIFSIKILFTLALQINHFHLTKFLFLVGWKEHLVQQVHIVYQHLPASRLLPFCVDILPTCCNCDVVLWFLQWHIWLFEPPLAINIKSNQTCIDLLSYLVRGVCLPPPFFCDQSPSFFCDPHFLKIQEISLFINLSG